jgi:uncharacterized protein YndB with AHSA1/START domain
MSTDRIEKQVLLRAPIARVWSAISDASEFGAWFGVKFDGPFAAGSLLTGAITPTTIDPEVAKSQEPYAGVRFEIWVEKIEPNRLLSFRWHPFAIDPDVDYSTQPTTLVEFILEEASEGVLLIIRESGFDQLPEARRMTAYQANEGGWSAQIKLVEKYIYREG